MRGRVTLGVGSPYLLGRVTLLEWPTFCHVNSWGRVTLLEGSTFVRSDYCLKCMVLCITLSDCCKTLLRLHVRISSGNIFAAPWWPNRLNRVQNSLRITVSTFRERPRWSWTSCQQEYEGKPLLSERCGRGLATWKINKVTGKNEESFASESATKRPKKWSWTLEAVEILLKYIKEFKSKCEFNDVDCEANLSTMYTEIDWCMVVDFPEDFGPEIVQKLRKELQDMNSEEYEFYREELEEQRKQIQNGY